MTATMRLATLLLTALLNTLPLVHGANLPALALPAARPHSKQAATRALEHWPNPFKRTQALPGYRLASTDAPPYATHPAHPPSHDTMRAEPCPSSCNDALSPCRGAARVTMPPRWVTYLSSTKCANVSP